MGAPKKQYSLSELQGTLTELLDQLGRGEEIVVTNNNLPIAKIVPLPPTAPGKRALGDVSGIWLFPKFHQTPDEFDDYL